MAARTSTDGEYDLAVVGAGIVGLAHAYAAAKAGARVVVIERDLAANGASIRNFGFITVTGQARGEVWGLAMRTRDLWAEVAGAAGVSVEHRGLLLTLRRPESVAVAEAFLATEMGRACEVLDAAALRTRCPEIAAPDTLGALASPHELRVESRHALPRLAAWLAEAHGVDVRFGTAVLGIEPPVVHASRGPIRARRAVVCPGDDFASLYPERLAPFGLTRCRLSMLRLADPGFRLPAGVMSDLGLVRYAGYAALPQAEALRRRLEAEQPRHLANGVHLIAVQSADGSLVVGDSHHYGEAADALRAGRSRGADPGRVPARHRPWPAARHRALDRDLRGGSGSHLPNRRPVGRRAARHGHRRLRRLDRLRPRRDRHRRLADLKERGSC